MGCGEGQRVHYEQENIQETNCTQCDRSCSRWRNDGNWKRGG